MGKRKRTNDYVMGKRKRTNDYVMSKRKRFTAPDYSSFLIYDFSLPCFSFLDLRLLITLLSWGNQEPYIKEGKTT
jgi:hypothetical protein